MIALQLTYNGVSLHDCGTVSIVSQRSDFAPDEYPQTETRSLAVRIDTFANDAGYNYDTLYANLQAVRAALAVQNGVLKWTSPGDTTAGEVLLERPVTVVSTDLPENPNAWGVFHQQINLVFRYELDVTDSGALTATVLGTGTVPSTITLGKVLGFKDDFANQFYSEWKNIRRRTSGTVSITGEFFRGLGETGSSTDNRLAEVLSDLANLRTQLTAGREIVLTYGPSDNRVFNQTVKVEAFNADIAQGPLTGKIRWSLTASYTQFPDEDGFAASEVSSSLSMDQGTGLETLALSGRVLAGTEALAVAKLGTVANAMLTAYGFTTTQQTRRDVTKSWVNADDTQNLATTNDGAAVAKTSWLELSFNYSYEKKAANITAYTLSVADADELRSGMLTRTYSGSVTASGATEEAAYAAALALAQSLGDKKHPFRVSKTETRNDRKLASQGALEFVRVEFQYVYQLKGTRVYLEMSTSVSADTFGESSERVSGFVVAETLAAAQAQYAALVRAGYASRLIRNETLDESQQIAQTGAAWYGASGFSTMPVKLDFSLTVFKEKTAGTFAIKYAVRVSSDYVSLTQNTSVEGVFVSPASEIAKIEAGTSNQLTDFLTTVSTGFGSEVSRQLDYDKEKVGTGDATPISVRFACQYVKSLSTAAQVLRCSLAEDITYSGTRWVSQQTPDGADTIQNCGITQATRTVTGEITAATETACMAWISKQHGANGLWENWRDTKPSTRYEEPVTISTRFEMAPLTDGSAGSTRSAATSTGAVFQVVTKSFTFREIVPNLSAPF